MEMRTLTREEQKKLQVAMDKMTSRGLRIDEPKLEKLIDEMSYLDHERQKLARFIGKDPWARKLFGLPSTRREVLLRHGTDLALQVALFREEHRKLQNLRKMQELTEDGVLKWEWSVAKTNRLYATGALLTLPKVCRSVVLPWSGEKFYLWDYKSQEMRLIAVVTGNEKLLRILEEGKDIHAITARVCNVERDKGKTINYAKMYGMDPEGLKSLYGLSDKMLRQIESYLPMDKLNEVAGASVESGTDRVKTYFGTELKFSDPKELGPYYIQGSGADILRMILVRMEDVMVDVDICIHDAVLTEDDKPVIREVMEFEINGMKFPVEMKSGADWGEVT